MTEPETSPKQATSRRWRDDPLSVFLAAAAVLLGAMYFLEQRDVDVLERASTRAQALGASLDLENCTVGSASTGGATLVITCASTAAEGALAAGAKQPNLTHFDAVVFIGSDVQLSCNADPSSWPNGCISAALPSP